MVQSTLIKAYSWQDFVTPPVFHSLPPPQTSSLSPSSILTPYPSLPRSGPSTTTASPISDSALAHISLLKHYPQSVGIMG